MIDATVNAAIGGDGWRGYIPIVGIVVTISPNFSLYKIVVLPAASNPTIRIRISFFPHSPWSSLLMFNPMLMWLLLSLNSKKIDNFFEECYQCRKSVPRQIKRL